MLRIARPTVLAVLVLALVAAPAALRAQVEAPPSPAAEPGTNEILMERTDLGNVAQSSRMSYHSGVRNLQRGDKLIEKAAEEANEKKRAGLEEKARKAYEQASADLAEALRLSSETYEAYATLGTVFRRLGDNGKALQVHAAALKIDPANGENFRGWAESLLALDMLGDATRAYSSLSTSNPAHAETLMEVMKTWLEAKRADPGDLNPADVERLAAWIEQQEAAASG